MRKLNFVVLVVITFAFASCGGGNHPEQPTSQAEIDAGQQAMANEKAFSSSNVQGEWELVEVVGANIEMYKGTVLKFDSDVMYKTQNENKQMGIFFIKDFVLNWTPQGLNKVTYKANIVDGKLQLINGADQTFVYKRI